MTNFVIGAVVGFLICVWALGATPGNAFSALWTKLEHVQEMSSAANQAYEAVRPRTTQQQQFVPTAPAPIEANNYR